MNNMSLSPIVESQFPDFIRESYPMFMQFVQEYYKFMETGNTSPQNVIQNHLGNIDIDSSLDEFLPKFIRAYPKSFPSLVSVDRRLLAKAMVYVYQTKGTEASFRTLFQLLYSEQIEISYPKTQMLRTSDGKWHQDSSIQVSVLSGDTNDLVGRIIYVKNTTGLVTANVVRVSKVSPTNYELFISNISKNTSFLIGDVIACKGVTFTGRIRPNVVGYDVFKGGKKFRVGQIFTVNNVSGTGAKVKVTKVDAQGSIQKVSFISFGTGYVTDFYAALVSSITQSGVVDPYASFTNGFIEAGFLTKDSGYFDSDYVEPSYAGTVLGTFSSNQYVPDNSQYDDVDAALIQIKLGAVSKYQGYYSAVDGFLSNAVVLQDGFMYQDFSYMIRSTLPVQSYRETVLDVLHPAGTKMFGEYQIRNDLDLDIFVEAERDISAFENVRDILDAIDELAILTTKNFAEFVLVSDTVRLAFTKLASDTVSTSDTNKFSVGKRLNDTVSPAEGLAKSMTKKMPIDTVSTSDTRTINLTKNFNDTSTTTDSKSISMGKVLSDVVINSDTGSILKLDYAEPSYFLTDYAGSVILTF